MEMLSDDPTYLAGGLGALGLVLLVATKATQQGKYLIGAGVALGLMVLVLIVEQIWVTDQEHIEETVYGLAKAVSESKAEVAASFLAPECRLDPGNAESNRLVQLVVGRIGNTKPADWLRQNLDNLQFDYLKITRLHTSAGAQSRLGTAEFTAHTMGRTKEPYAGFGTPPAGMEWSFGLREVEPGQWKITRISPGRIDFGATRPH